MRVYRSPIIIGLFLLMAALPFNIAATKEIKIYTLDQSIREAFANNWSIRAKKEKVNEAFHIKNQAKAEFLPKLSTSYGYTRKSEVPIFRASIPGGGLIKLGTWDNYQWKGSLTQSIFTGFALLSSYELAKLGIDQRQLELDLEKLDLALKVKEAYFNILKADRAVEVAEKAVESLESHVQVARNFYKVGMTPVNDLLKAEVELANAQHNLVKAQNTSRLVRSAYNILLSRPINEPVQVEDILSYKPERGEYEEYLDSALKNRQRLS